MGWVFDNDDKFYLHHNEILLDGLIRTQRQCAFECRQGYCGSCKTKIQLLSGSVRHKFTPLCLLNDDEILACCCMIDGTIKIVTKNT